MKPLTGGTGQSREVQSQRQGIAALPRPNCAKATTNPTFLLPLCLSVCLSLPPMTCSFSCTFLCVTCCSTAQRGVSGCSCWRVRWDFITLQGSACEMN